MLSKDDVEKLMRDPSPLVRAEVAEKLAKELEGPRLSDKDLALAQDVVRAMANDMAVVVRAALAENLKQSSKLPHDIAMKLANDVEQVALPILEASNVLSEQDLIQLVQSAGENKQAAIARRDTVSENLSAAIIDKGGEKAVSTLVGNNGAKIQEQSYKQAIERFTDNETVQRKLVERDKLPVTIAERLLVMVSDQLKDYLVSKHEVSPTLAADVILRSREKATVGLSAGIIVERDVEQLVTQLYRNKRLTPSLVLRALCMGDLPFFEYALSLMGAVPIVNARLLIHDAGRLGLKSVYDKSGMPTNFLPAVRVAIDVLRETELDGQSHDRERFRRRVIERILTQFEDMAEADINYLLDKLGDIIQPAA